jgi:DNA-binding MarR family transcriptional regulator
MKSLPTQIEVILEAMGGLMRRMHMHKHRMPLFGDKTIGRAQIEILMMLAHCEQSPTMRDLATHLRVTGGAMTQIIAPLLKKELVEKIADRRDKRVTRIVLTPSAKELITKAKKEYVAAIAPAFEVLSAEDIEALARILSKLSHATKTA